MANRRFEMYQYRQILARMRSGDSDRDIAGAGLVGRRKAAEIRREGANRGWLDSNRLLGAATIDKLRHNAYRVVLDGKSYRAPKPFPKNMKNEGEKTTKIDK